MVLKKLFYDLIILQFFLTKISYEIFPWNLINFGSFLIIQKKLIRVLSGGILWGEVNLLSVFSIAQWIIKLIQISLSLHSHFIRLMTLVYILLHLLKSLLLSLLKSQFWVFEQFSVTKKLSWLFYLFNDNLSILFKTILFNNTKRNINIIEVLHDLSNHCIVSSLIP